MIPPVDETPLPDGTVTRDPRLDRLVSFDDRSRSFPIRAALDDHEAKPRTHEWPLGIRLNQGREGACTGFAVTHEAAAEPDPVPGLDDEVARSVYRRAQQLDEWPGEDYSGSSVLAAVKAGVELGWYREYRWAFGLDDLILALSWKGPAVLGIPWYEGMENTDGYAHVNVAGGVTGGHAIVANAVDVENFGGRVKLTNSWGADWGWHGTCWITFADLDRLLHEQGEACIPLLRSAPAAA
jgi:hypothetical protein